MSTTTPEEHKMVAYLSAITGLDPEAFGTKLLERGMNIEGATMEDLLVRDTKRYELFGKNIDHIPGRGSLICLPTGTCRRNPAGSRTIAPAAGH